MQHRSIKANNPKKNQKAHKLVKKGSKRTISTVKPLSIRPKPAATSTIPSPALTISLRTMAAQPSGHKAFQIAGATNAQTPLNSQTSKSKIRAEMLKNYNRDGYALVKNVFSPADIDSIHNEMVDLCRGTNPAVVGLSTIDSNSLPAADEALAAYSCIEFPLKACEKTRKKIFSNPQILTGLKTLIGNNIKCVSSEYWIQSPNDYAHDWVQDESTIMTRDKSLVLALIALDDLTTENGTPLLHPASHKSGILYPTRRQDGENDGSDTSYDWQSFVKQVEPRITPLGDDQPSDHFENLGTIAGLQVPTTAKPIPQPRTTTIYDQMDSITSVPVEMPAGSVLFVNGYTLQRMMQNPISDKFRRLLRVHFTSAETQVSWNYDPNDIFSRHLEGLSPSQLLDIRDIALVAGTDPYEYKGYQNIFPTEVVRRQGAPIGF